jgi:hypothetical protein
MLRRLLALKPFIVGLVVVSLGCAVAAIGSFSGENGLSIAAAQQKNLTPVPVPAGIEVPADPALLKAIAVWEPTKRGIPTSAPTGGRDTHLLDCHSGRVNFTVTHGWCYASAAKLFFNVTQETFKDPRTGQLFTYDKITGKLFAKGRVDDIQQGLEPPSLAEKHAANAPETVSQLCTTGQLQDINKHVQNLGKNADRSDSPIMQALFKEQALWWQSLCV